MEEVIIVFILQAIYVVFKFLNTRGIVLRTQTKVQKAIITVIATSLYYFSTVIGVHSYIKGNYLVAVAFVLATLTGVFIEDYIEQKKLDKKANHDI